MTVVAAMGQMFYSLSIAMGILYTYGSYVRKDMDIERSTTQVEVFDTGIAILAGLMIIPAVFSFSGGNSTFMDELHWSRKKCCGLMVVIMIVLGTASSMGYGLLDFIRIFGMNFLDFFDFMTNSVMMPLAALATCVLILRVVGIDGMVKEIEQSSPFRRKKLYRVFIKYFAPICLIIILLSSIANVLGIISM